ncbi:MAG: HEPN domain-containing protein [Candidatus Omnitrophica bacterium]|nr:HEPN domain-containing protein [Candidatus Omnitrophota bacterium]MBU4590848.1 HEPN domain-containing protein [Candidatus Omnitrophota bacterium]
MSYQGLLKEGKIKIHQASSEEIKDVLEVADRDLSFAKDSMTHNWDWAFTIAYNAALSASRAYMYKLGYRPSSAESHKTVWRFMLLALPEQHHDRINFFNRMRVKRNRNLYDHVGLISQTEVAQIIASAERHAEVIKKLTL